MTPELQELVNMLYNRKSKDVTIYDYLEAHRNDYPDEQTVEDFERARELQWQSYAKGW